MPWTVPTLLLAGSLTGVAYAPVLASAISHAPGLPVVRACPALVSGVVAPRLPFRLGSVLPEPIPTRVDAQGCPIPLAGGVTVKP